MIHVTPAARAAIERFIAEEGGDGCLRVAVRGGGCSGLVYDLSIDREIRDDDTVVEVGDVRILVDSKSRLFLHGLTLDYSGGLNGRGFVFSNPNATGTCGCGSSFSA